MNLLFRWRNIFNLWRHGQCKWRHKVFVSTMNQCDVPSTEQLALRIPKMCICIYRNGTTLDLSQRLCNTCYQSYWYLKFKIVNVPFRFNTLDDFSRSILDLCTVNWNLVVGNSGSHDECAVYDRVAVQSQRSSVICLYPGTLNWRRRWLLSLQPGAAMGSDS